MITTLIFTAYCFRDSSTHRFPSITCSYCNSNQNEKEEGGDAFRVFSIYTVYRYCRATVGAREKIIKHKIPHKILLIWSWQHFVDLWICFTWWIEKNLLQNWSDPEYKNIWMLDWIPTWLLNARLTWVRSIIKSDTRYFDFVAYKYIPWNFM